MIALLAGWRGWLAAGLLGAVLLAGAYQTGVNAERKRGEAAQLRTELQTVQADRRLAEQALIAARAAAADLEVQSQHDQEALDALRKALAARPEADRCPASADDLDLLYGRP